MPDLTGDGVADLAGVDGNNALHYYRGDGHGSLTDVGTAWAGFGPWWAYTRITVADFNGDGHADIAGVDPYNDLRLWTGDGAGHWYGGGLMWPAGGNWGDFKYLVGGDFNNDGRADLVAYGVGDGNPRFYAGDGQGHVSGVPLMGLPSGAFTGFSDIVGGDFNNDGNMDIAAVTASHDLALYLGDGTGHLVAAGAGALMWPAGGAWTRRIASGDFNGDGFVDVVQVTAAGDLALYAGDGTGHLRTSSGQAMSTPGVWWTNHKPAGTPSSACFQGRTVIEPLGDSITYGTASSSGDGYRGPLGDLLGQAAPMGSSWLYEGSTNSGSRFWSHEGHGGYTIDQVAAGVQGGWLPVAGNAHLPVNLVLLDAGTNDAGISNHSGSQMLTSMSALLDAIHTADPGARVLVAQITITGRDTVAQQSAEQAFDNGLPALAAGKGSWVRVVDMRGVALSGDQLHPGDAGYQDMAGRWYAALATAGWLPS